MSRGRRSSPSIRRLLAILLGVLGLLVAALILVTTLQLRRSAEQADVENRRTESLRVADSMRQSSNDLTQMVRLYVSTGESRYREHYDEILAIRSGTGARPLGYDSTFWDRVLAEGEGFVEYGPPESLVDQMRAAAFTDEEFDALNASLRTSDQLARLELDVMDLVAVRIAEGVDEQYATDVGPEYARLVDEEYLAEKGAIMRAIDEFVGIVDRRTQADVEDARDGIRRLVAVQIVILAVILLVGACALVVTGRLVLRPLDRLIGTARHITDGDYAQRADVSGVSELERLATTFNVMAGAVETDVAAREHAEHVAVEAREAAEGANRAKSSFLAAMSHEIRTPMIGVTGMLEVLAQDDLTPAQRQMVETAQSSAAALLQIIGDTLDFSKIEAGRLEIVPSTFALRQVVDAAVATFIHTASAKGLLLVAACDEQIAPAHVGDPLRVRQILSNLLSNAVKFTDVGGIEVHASVRDEPGDGTQVVELAVVDTGGGVSDEQQRRLFAEFTQAEPSTAHRHGGTGLGLVICQRLAQLMGGEITMESAVGRGTTMRLVLPLPVGDADAVIPEAGAAPPRFRTGRTRPSRDDAVRGRELVLVAEDHSVNRAVLLHQLDAIGVRADTAVDGQEALEMFATGDYAMVVTDVHMPRLDGYGLAQAIRDHEARHGWARTPVMALTANVMHGEPQRCRDAGMDDFAAKPTTIPLLAAKLRSWLPHLEFPAASLVDGSAGDAVRGMAGGGERDDDVLDTAALDELTGGDADLARALLDDFTTSTTDDVAHLDEAIAAGDLEQVRRQAHRIKGAAAAVGARHLTAAAARIEDAATEGEATSTENLRAWLDDVTTALHAVTAHQQAPG